MRQLRLSVYFIIIAVLMRVDFIAIPCHAEEMVSIGLNYSETGTYSIQGLDQLRAATLAIEEINGAGGILGKKVRLVTRDSMSMVDVTYRNVTELIEDENVSMVFGGSSSSVAIAASDVCRRKGIIFFGTLTYSTAITGSEGNRYTFRECYNSWMGAKTLAAYLNDHFPVEKNKYFYITADYTWGHTTEASMRHFTGTENIAKHKRITTPFPGATDRDFRKVISFAKIIDPDVLVLVLFGKDMSTAIRQATMQGLKAKMQIVVPNLTLGMAESGGPKVMEGVIGTLPWTWGVPYAYNFTQGQSFVEKFTERFGRYPSTSGASAYTIVHEYKAAVERAGTLRSDDVIRELEGHTYQSLKDEQTWRAFDHQSVQTVYAVKCRPSIEVMKDRYKLNYFEIIDVLPGEAAARTREEWNSARVKAARPLQLD